MQLRNLTPDIFGTNLTTIADKLCRNYGQRISAAVIKGQLTAIE